MDLTRQQAFEQLQTWTTKASLLNHARAVEIVMCRAASQYGGEPSGSNADERTWGIAGLLHDADYDRWPEEHPQRIVAWLREKGEEEIAYAISAHYTKWGSPPKTALDKALLACDELTGFVVACCLVRPDGIASLKPKSVKKKLKDKSFAAKVDRGEIGSGIELLGADRDDHIRFIIETLQPHADELGIGGNR